MLFSSSNNNSISLWSIFDSHLPSTTLKKLSYLHVHQNWTLSFYILTSMYYEKCYHNLNIKWPWSARLILDIWMELGVSMWKRAGDPTMYSKLYILCKCLLFYFFSISYSAIFIMLYRLYRATEGRNELMKLIIMPGWGTEGQTHTGTRTEICLPISNARVVPGSKY